LFKVADAFFIIYKKYSALLSNGSHISSLLLSADSMTKLVLVNFYFRLQISISGCSFCSADCSQLMNGWNLWKLGTLQFHLQLASLSPQSPYKIRG